MTTLFLTQAQTLLLAMFVFFLGAFLHSQLRSLKKYNIPEPVIGGILVSIAFAILYKTYQVQFILDQELKADLMLTFFATVGLSAKFSSFRNGGKKILIFLLVAAVFLVIQNIVGIICAKALGLEGNLGLIAGSITLSGGHGTGVAYALNEKFSSITGAMELAMACATFGLIIGGIIGGPISQLLIARYKLAPDNEVENPDEALKDHGFNEPETVTSRSILQVLLSSFVALYTGTWLAEVLNPLLVAHNPNMKVPEFILVLFTGIIITNLSDLTTKYKVHKQSTDLVNLISLTLFLSIAMMNLKLWELLHLALPLIIIILVQTAVMALYSYYVTFRALGKDYDAAVVAGGHCGFGLGATPTAVANIESVTHRYGDAPHAMFTILMVGAFFIDLTNIIVIQLFLIWL